MTPQKKHSGHVATKQVTTVKQSWWDVFRLRSQSLHICPTNQPKAAKNLLDWNFSFKPYVKTLPQIGRRNYCKSQRTSKCATSGCSWWINASWLKETMTSLQLEALWKPKSDAMSRPAVQWHVERKYTTAEKSSKRRPPTKCKRGWNVQGRVKDERE